MYYPKQIPYLLNKPFQNHVDYVEYHFQELESYCMCIWQMKSKQTLNKPIYNFILPDACIDIVIDFTKHEICFSGFSKETELLELNGDVDYLGIRLKPSIFYSIFKMNADKIMDTMTSFSNIENSDDLKEIFICEKKKRIEVFKDYLIQKTKNIKNVDFTKIVDTLYESPKDKLVKEISENFGYNHRQLFRIFKKQYGISPKVLLNILRLHLCLNLLLEENMKLCDIANLCGFYDQSHFIKEIKRYTGISPLQILENLK